MRPNNPPDKKIHHLDELPPEDIIALMDAADRRAMRAVEAARTGLARAATSAAKAIGGGGRLIYVGAGTSGRLGVLDASECPPTFSAKPGQVVGLIAGGRKAVTGAVEGAEDDTGAGRRDIEKLKAGRSDMVLGITASGTTPYVMAALEESAVRGADAWLLTCTPIGPPPFTASVITLDTGQEVVIGSTRLAAGTATKLALNRVTTACFILLGKVHDDLMVDVAPTNAKLVKRASGIIMKLTGCDAEEAGRLLAASGMSAKVAVVMKTRGLGRREAEELLKSIGGSLRAAVEKAGE